MRCKQVLAYGAAAVLTAAGMAHAQQVFKYVMPDGRIVYSDKSVPGGRLVDEIAPPPPSAPAPSSAAPARQEQLQEQRGALRERLSDRNRELDRASAQLDSARARLAEAQQRLEAGKEPLPGERTGNQGGGSRLNELYWQRQSANEAAVAQARDQVKRAEAELAQLR
jgi:hypothetical protein